jgi:hypothetical protein
LCSAFFIIRLQWKIKQKAMKTTEAYDEGLFLLDLYKYDRHIYIYKKVKLSP